MARRVGDNAEISFRNVDSSAISRHEVEVLRQQIYSMRHPHEPERVRLWPVQCRPKESNLKGFATQRVYEWETPTKWFRAYEVEVHKFVGFRYSLDFTGTVNHDVRATFKKKGMRVVADLQPFELETVCLVTREKKRRAKLNVTVQWVTTDVNMGIAATALAMNQQRISKEYEMMRNHGIDARSQDVQTMRHKLSGNGVRFVDEAFYPSNASLYVEGDKSAQAAAVQVMWRRATDFCAQPAVFKLDELDQQLISPDDVARGSTLGNKWFTACVAALAARPELVRRLFTTEDYHPSGIYEMRFIHEGLWKVVLLDDFLPCRPYGGPVYADTPGDEIWVSLLEKAFAKIYGSYERIVTGSPYYGMADLTGCPCCVFELNDPADVSGLWDRIVKWAQDDNWLVTATCGDASRENPVADGLELDVSYTLQAAHEALGVRLLELRFPWEQEKPEGWRGDWCEDSELWTTRARRAFAPHGLLPRTTYMCYEDFLIYFQTVVACHVRRDWSDVRAAALLSLDTQTGGTDSQAIELVVPDGCEVEWVGQYQTDSRAANHTGVLDLGALITRETEDGNEAIGFTKVEQERQVFTRFGEHATFAGCTLASGVYQIIPFTSGTQWQPHMASSTTAAYAVWARSRGVDQPTVRRADTVSSSDLQDTLLAVVGRFGRREQLHEVSRHTLRMGDVTVYAATNQSTDTSYTVCAQGDMDNLLTAPNYGDMTSSNGIEVELAPGEGKILSITCKADKTQSAACALKFTVKGPRLGSR